MNYSPVYMLRQTFAIPDCKQQLKSVRIYKLIKPVMGIVHKLLNAIIII